MLVLTPVMMFLWIAPTILQAAILFIMLRRGTRKNFPWFYQYTAFQFVSNIVLYGVQHWGSYTSYFYSYWASSAMAAGLGFMVIHEIFQQAFRPYEALRDFSAIMFRWAGLVLLLMASVVAFSFPGSANTDLVTGILVLERSVLVMQAGMLLLLMLLSTRIGLSWRDHGFGIALGFGLFATGQLIANSLRSQIGLSFAQSYALLECSVYLMGVVIWTSYFFSPQAERATRRAVFTSNPVLDRWNQVLRGDVSGDVSFMPNLEKIVDRVLMEKK